ncbi:MAG: polyphosphate kinase 2 family protein, partial [Anaerotignaceae bacterium]
MLHEDSSPQSVSIKNAKQEIKELQKRFSVLQQKIKDAKIPVIILIDGWSASGKGTIISQISSQLEARGYNVYSSAKPEEGESRRPYLWRFWRDIPAAGEITVFERGWYRQALEEMLSHSKNKDSTIDSINNFERQLSDDGHVVLKFFLNIDKDTQKKRLDD